MVNNTRTAAAVGCAIALAFGVTSHARVGGSAVADAAMQADAAAVRALLQQGADVNAAEGDGMTALHWAAEHGDPDLASLLLKAGANTRAETRIGRHTPLHIAAKTGNPRVVRL